MLIFYNSLMRRLKSESRNVQIFDPKTKTKRYEQTHSGKFPLPENLQISSGNKNQSFFNLAQ